ncbi:MAG: prolyl oligopeptidase family serine peptidase, partial [Muribaculaceae bacterium]|nr:prolyl oligopeptidase family serine peptidase [Muribaculaceae bacterium]
MRLLSSILLFAATAVYATAQEVPCTIQWADSARTYYMAMPETLAPGNALIIYTHGYSSRNPIRKDLTEAALNAGIAVAYPVGAPDSRGKRGWNVGYPPQYNLPDNEEDYMEALADTICRQFGLNRANVFCTGMSNGGDLCYQIMYRRPNIFKAYASVAGLTFTNSFLSHRLSTPKPFMEIHGTADKTSMWDGDPDNTGGWGPYISVPLAVDAIAYNNRCTRLTTDTVPALPTAKNPLIIRHTYSGSPY